MTKGQRVRLVVVVLLLWNGHWSASAAGAAEAGAAQSNRATGGPPLEFNLAQTESPVETRREFATETPRQPRNWDVLFYGGKFVDVTFRHIIFKGETDYLPSYVWVAGLNYKLGQLVGPITIETEGQVARHTGIQDNWEINALMIARSEWIWRNAFSFSLALGDGFSLAS